MRKALPPTLGPGGNVRAKSICVGFRSLKRNFFFFFKALAEQLVAFQPTGFLRLSLAPWCRCLQVRVGGRE